MIVVPGFEGRTVAVLGLARSGRAAVAALMAGGADVFAWDDSEKTRSGVAAELPLRDPTTIDWHEVAALMLSPGIPHSFPAPHPAVAAARAAGVPIIGDIELLGRAEPAARTIAITGTNGKSTTTALIGHILATAGVRVAVGGNLGPPALGLVPLGAGGTYVLELSSFQLELVTTFAFDISVLLNITPDHLDRHGDMAGYIAAKQRIFARQGADASAIVGVDDDICREIAAGLRLAGIGRIVPISVREVVRDGVYVDDFWLVDAFDGDPIRVFDLREAPRLPGSHNAQNAAAAYAVARRAGLSAEAAIAGIRTFPGLAHRQELVGTIDSVRYINDSKATNADATEKALACYEAIYWIVGGLPKAGGITSLAPHFQRLRHAFLIGNATEEFAATLDDKVPYTRCGDLANALAAASERARGEQLPGAVVLLSPACASYDQFPNFEVRGDTFRRLVGELPGAHPPEAGAR
ncbi:MAG TPA: UDP-N-acetylmuramoyl-L-alanine--D-glutamate ligase [Stellaceae bacterium]|nr:UDP-N-acetylmuramoyl-L-alanine--D-glutamate ligase [Stellaceae bacterium]